MKGRVVYRERVRDDQRGEERNLSFAGFLLKWLQSLELGWAIARNMELYQGFQCGESGPRSEASSAAVLGVLGWNWIRSVAAKPLTSLMWDAGIAASDATTLKPNTGLFLAFNVLQGHSDSLPVLFTFLKFKDKLWRDICLVLESPVKFKT